MTLEWMGIACIVGAIVAGGIKMLGVSFPVISSVPRQLLLAAFGAVLFWLGLHPNPSPPPPPKPTASTTIARKHTPTPAPLPKPKPATATPPSMPGPNPTPPLTPKPTATPAPTSKPTPQPTATPPTAPSGTTAYAAATENAGFDKHVDGSEIKGYVQLRAAGQDGISLTVRDIRESGSSRFQVTARARCHNMADCPSADKPVQVLNSTTDPHDPLRDVLFKFPGAMGKVTSFEVQVTPL